MARRHRTRFVALAARLADHPDVTNPIEAIVHGYIRVDGRIITNQRALVRDDAAIRVVRPSPLRGEHNLGAALDALQIDPAGLVAVDIGAAAGGFTRALLRRGADLREPELASDRILRSPVARYAVRRRRLAVPEHQRPAALKRELRQLVRLRPESHSSESVR